MASCADGDASGNDGFRCWICLDDATTLDGWIAPCKCVGTNKWVHESCAPARPAEAQSAR